jgi:hypothetical protein
LGASDRAILFGNLAGMVIGAWVAFVPWPAWFAVPVAGAAPLVAIAFAAASRGRISLGAASPTNKRPTLLLLVLCPAAGLGWLAYRQFRLLYFTEMVWVALAACLVVAAAIAFAIGRADRREMGDGLMFVGSGALGLAWALGLVTAINSDLSPHAVVLTPGAIIDKRVIHYRRSGPDYRVTVGTPIGEETFPVSEPTYDGLFVGDRECIARKEGILRIWWRDFGPCPNH